MCMCAALFSYNGSFRRSSRSEAWKIRNNMDVVDATATHVMDGATLCHGYRRDRCRGCHSETRRRCRSETDHEFRSKTCHG